MKILFVWLDSEGKQVGARVVNNSGTILDLSINELRNNKFKIDDIPALKDNLII